MSASEAQAQRLPDTREDPAGAAIATGLSGPFLGSGSRHNKAKPIASFSKALIQEEPPKGSQRGDSRTIWPSWSSRRRCWRLVGMPR